MRHSILIKAVLMATLIFSAFFLRPVHAAALEECRLTEQLKELEEVQKNFPWNETALSEELRIRRGLLTSVLNCASSEIKTLQGNLKDTTPDAGLQKIQGRFSSQLESATRYYNEQKPKIDLLNIIETKILARSILEWREINYAPVAQKIESFVTWKKNHELVIAAKERFTQIIRTIENLKLGNYEDIKKFLKDAQSNLDQAAQYNELAKQVFINLELRDDSLRLVRASLQELSTAYERFFDISQAVNKVFPYY